MSDCSGPDCGHSSHKADPPLSENTGPAFPAPPVLVAESTPVYKGRRRRLEFSRAVGDSVTDRSGRKYIVQPGGFLQKAGHTRRLTKAEKKREKKARRWQTG